MGDSSTGVARPLHRPPRFVQLQVARPQLLGVGDALAARRPGGPAQHGAHPGHQRLDRERLGDVVVAAERQPGDRVRRGVPGRQEDDRHLVPPGPEPAAHLEPVQVRQHHVQHDQVRPVRLGLPQRVLAGGRGGHGAAVELQGDLNQLTDVGLVVDDEHRGNLVAVTHGFPLILPHAASAGALPGGYAGARYPADRWPRVGSGPAGPVRRVASRGQGRSARGRGRTGRSPGRGARRAAGRGPGR